MQQFDNKKHFCVTENILIKTVKVKNSFTDLLQRYNIFPTFLFLQNIYRSTIYLFPLVIFVMPMYIIIGRTINILS